MWNIPIVGIRICSPYCSNTGHDLRNTYFRTNESTMEIINSDIITEQADIFWESLPARLAALPARAVLVITGPLDHQGPAGVQLQKLLEACKLQPDQFNVIEMADGEQIAWHRLRFHFRPRVVFLFGVLPSVLGISALFGFNAYNQYDETIWLPTLPLADLSQRDDVKKQLWLNGMKPVFVELLFGEILLQTEL